MAHLFTAAVAIVLAGIIGLALGWWVVAPVLFSW